MHGLGLRRHCASPPVNPTNPAVARANEGVDGRYRQILAVNITKITENSYLFKNNIVQLVHGE